MKRGSSGLSLFIGVDKEHGSSSHDVVNKVRRIFDERRVGHAGTLDPMATGVLPVMIGPATKLSDYLTGHDKSYICSIRFGTATTTDDEEGDIVRRGDVPSKVYDEEYAKSILNDIVGKQKQIPPAYSAIKINGKRSYEYARKGNIIRIEPRDIEIYKARLLGIEMDPHDGLPAWNAEFTVSKGTYIRSIARDIGLSIDCPSHLSSLRRTEVGMIGIDDCVSLDTLQDLREGCALDPIRALPFRFAIADDLARYIDNGNPIDPSSLELLKYASQRKDACACTSGVMNDMDPYKDSEKISLLIDNRLKAIYSYDPKRNILKPATIFTIGVERDRIY